MRSVMLELPIEPVAWQRVKRGRLGQAYVPKKTREFERELSLLARAKFKDEIFSGPLRISVAFYLEKPKRPKFEFPAVRPDLDNYLKALKDGLTGVVWKDDSLVCVYGHETGKYYTDRDAPYILLKVEELE